ncbi:MAG: SUMF1/EgtB/PvdO family nonheme iron enzyme [Clostridia bacterium]|nr:SUMF1/EgtB/PvdO family nonheme iron enzyme [Clostridia bacterium]
MTDTKELAKRFPGNRVMTDCVKRGSVMVFVPRFYLDEVIDGAAHTPHPAFIVNGKELDGIYISKFQNVIVDGLAYSLPDQDPATRISFDDAISACVGKGEGFHLMTAAEWSAIALWCQKNDLLPFGNNDLGKDVREETAVATISFCNAEKTVCRTATGSGPLSWSHNARADGIYDLNANVWEWMGGLRLVYGELQVLPYNDAACSRYELSADSAHWRAIDGKNGGFLIPDGKGTTQNSVKLDFIDNRWVFVCDTPSSASEEFRSCSFACVSADDSVCEKARELLYALTCLPCRNDTNKEVSLFASNGSAERIPFRGGRWGQGLNSGLFKTCFDDPRTYAGDAVGFRSAYYEIS